MYQELACAAANLKTQRELMPNVEEVARITRDFALAGEGRAADADRALTERNLLIAEIQKTEGSLFAASARLAERLNLDPTTRLVPASQDFQALTIIDDRLPIADLIRVAVNQRPELAEGDAMIAEAGARVQQERWRPWLPTLWMGGSGGVFGGGSNLVPPTIGNFGGRTDFDVRAFWTLLNFGAGNRALQRQRMAERGQAVARRQASLNLVREQIASAQAGSIAARAQIDQRARAVLLAEEGFNQDLARTREGQGRPIEVLNNLNRLVRARLDLNISVLDYVSEQLRLYVALGSPPPPTGFSTGTSGGTSLTTSPSAR
jgi:outer membrane protein TolC